MMDLQAAFRARLLANAPLSAAVSGRIYWGIRPQGSALPALVLTKVAPGQDWTHSGPGPMVNPWVQIDIYSADYPAAGPIAAALQAEMQRLNRVTAGGWTFFPPGTLASDQWPGVESLPDGIQAHRVIQDYRFWAEPI